MARKLTRELDAAIARLEGSEPERDLVSIVCHDLKDPLASIVMGAGYLKKTMGAAEGGDGGDTRSARRVVDAIARSAERMGQVIGDFHDLSKLEAGTLEVTPRSCDVVAALHGAMAPLEALATERSIELRMDAPGEPVLARCDRARLVTIFSKLVGNAIKFTPPKGAIAVRVVREEGGVRVSVSDTGRGIPPEIRDAIFDHAANARRTPREGPGLGLPIARGLVEAQGGALCVESRVGEGSTFTFVLPRPD